MPVGTSRLAGPAGRCFIDDHACRSSLPRALVSLAALALLRLVRLVKLRQVKRLGRVPD